MKRLVVRLTVIVLALCAAGFASQAARAQTIECPLSSATRTITNPLPEEWWTTPILGNLTDTEVSTIGGEAALICRYGAAGSVQRYAPANNCTATPTGFSCPLSLIPGIITDILIPGIIGALEPTVHSQGTFNLQGTFSVDFDNGAITSGAPADLWLQVVSTAAAELYLSPEPGSLIAVDDASDPGYAGCRDAALTGNRVAVFSVPIGNYVCLRTDQGRVTRFRIMSYVSLNPITLQIEYTTW